ADDQRDVQMCFLHGGDDAGGDDVAVHDTAEDVDEDAFDVRVLEDDFERRGDLFLARAASDVEEVGRHAAVMLDDVHGGHGQAGAVDEAGDAAVELDVIQVELAGFDFERRFFVQVAHLLDVLVAIERVVVERDLGVEGHDGFLAVGQFNDGERVEFDHGGVAFPPGIVDAGDEFDAGVEQVALEAERRGDLAGLVGHDADGGIDVFLENFLRMFFGDFFDVHAAFGAGHDERTGIGAVEEDGEVKFFFDLRAGGEEQCLDLAAFGAGLFGDEDVAEHFFGEADRFIDGGGEFDAALETGFESAFAAAAGVDLGLDDDFGAAGGGDFFGGGTDFGERFGRDLERSGDSVFGEQLFGLVFVDVHLKISS